MGLFKDQALNKELETYGLVKLRLPNSSIVDVCQEVFDKHYPSLPPETQKYFYSAVQLQDYHVKKDISDSLRSAFSSFLEDTIKNHKALVFTFLIKDAAEKSMLDIHQDWSIVDEREHCSYSFWVPLSNSTKKNGTIYALLGSHRFPLNIRGAGIPPKYFPVRDSAIARMKRVDVKRGELLIFDQSLIHYSPPNNSKEPRIAVVSSIIPENASPRLYHCEDFANNPEINSYDVPDEFYLLYDDFINQKDNPHPAGVFKGPVSHANTDRINETEFEKLLTLLPKRKVFSIFR